MPETQALVGKREIMSYLKISKEALNILIKHGLPVKRAGKFFIGHKTEIDNWFLVSNQEQNPSN